jgi:hypothetical protein
MQELAAVDSRLVALVDRVRWSTLCEQPMRFVERRYEELWAELSAAADTSEESAA